MHSFTPVFMDAQRPWHAGVLYNRDRKFASVLMALLTREVGLLIGDNEPYSVSDASDYTIPLHGERRGVVHVEIEMPRPDRRRPRTASLGGAPGAVTAAGVSGDKANRGDGARVSLSQVTSSSARRGFCRFFPFPYEFARPKSVTRQARALPRARHTEYPEQLSTPECRNAIDSACRKVDAGDLNRCGREACSRSATELASANV